MYDPSLKSLVVDSIVRLNRELERSCPHMAPAVSAWIRGRSDTPEPADYYTHPNAFPTLLFPWWIGKSFEDAPAVAFQGDVIYSTVNGYYFVRILDNLLDGNATIELKILPASIFFHTNFLSSYYRHFPASHEFWKYGHGISFATADAIFKDATLGEVDFAMFKRISAQKTGAARIPIAAACHYYQRPDLIPGWFTMSELFSSWSQMFDDIFDCFSDSAAGTQTYFITEGERRKRVDETLVEWVAREGLDWGAGLLHAWMAEMTALAMKLNSDALLVYLDGRLKLFEERRAEIQDGLRSIAALGLALRGQ
jgi:hypothetical protein